MFLFKCLYLIVVFTRNAAQRERVEVGESIIFRSLISLCFITCLIHISLNLKNDQKNRPHDPATKIQKFLKRNAMIGKKSPIFLFSLSKHDLFPPFFIVSSQVVCSMGEYMAANKAFLALPSSSSGSRRLSIVFRNGETGVDMPIGETEGASADDWYTGIEYLVEANRGRRKFISDP